MWKGNREINDFSSKISDESYADDIQYGGELFADIRRDVNNLREEVEL